MICPRCKNNDVPNAFKECDRCINEMCTPFEDMPQGYKDGVKIAAQKLSDEIDKEIFNHYMEAL